MMVEGLKNEPASTPCVFSDQMGRGRTTAGMIAACLIKEIQITTELRSVELQTMIHEDITIAKKAPIILQAKRHRQSKHIK